MEEEVKRSKLEIGQSPAGLEGPGFSQLLWRKQLGWHAKIQSGLYRLLLPVAALNSWQPWHLIMILAVLVRSD